MSEQMPDIKSLLEVSGIRVAEFSKLSAVSEVMVYRWIKGGNANALRLPKLNKLNETIKALVADNKLPLSSEVSTSERLDNIKTLLVSQLRKSS